MTRMALRAARIERRSRGSPGAEDAFAQTVQRRFKLARIAAHPCGAKRHPRS
jgi:hypothetical protein